MHETSTMESSDKIVFTIDAMHHRTPNTEQLFIRKF